MQRKYAVCYLETLHDSLENFKNLKYFCDLVILKAVCEISRPFMCLLK